MSSLPGPERLIALVADEGHGVDLSAVTVHDHGWENLVLETSDGWILRFLRGEHVPFDRELVLLQQLAGHVSVEIPRVAWTGRLPRYMAYRTLTGDTFDGDEFLRLPETQRDVLAHSLAQFLAEMHDAMSTAHAAGLGVLRVNQRRPLDLVTRRIDQVPREHRPAVDVVVEQFVRSWIDGEPPGPAVVLHNDFHPGNMVFSRGQLSGIWDFSCVEVGPASYDLRYLDGEPRDLLDRVAPAYERMTSRQVDVAAAIAANRMEHVYDALDTGRLELLDEAVTGWVRADAGG